MILLHLLSANSDIRTHSFAQNLRPVVPGDCPPAMRALIEQCWSLHAEKRPEFWQIVKVLEQFESSLNQDGTLNSVPNLTRQDHKKGLLHRIQKLGPVHLQSNASSILKPKFTWILIETKLQLKRKKRKGSFSMLSLFVPYAIFMWKRMKIDW